MATENGIIKGKRVVGYRYGAAPVGGKSWNSAENRCENGVSMARIGHMEEVRSFAVMNLREKKVKKYYYDGVVASDGSDGNEICLTDIKEISHREFCEKKKENEIMSAVNSIVDFFADRRIELINDGWNLGTTAEAVEEWRRRNKR